MKTLEELMFVDRREALQAQRAIHGEQTMIALSEIFKILGDQTRLKICMALEGRELCVGDLALVAGISESAVSHQLHTLKTLRLVRFRKEGKLTYYRLDDHHIEQLIALGVRHVEERYT